MKLIIFVLAVSIAGFAYTDDFQNRLEAGRQALQTSEGKVYEKSLSPTIVRAMGECVPPGPPDQTGAFSLVGYVNPSGTVSAIEVQPSTPASRCFAGKIGKATLPTPPFVPSRYKAFPLTIDMEIIP